MAFIPHCLKLFNSIDLEVKAFVFAPRFARLWLLKQILKLSKQQGSYFYRAGEIMQQNSSLCRSLSKIMVLLDVQVTSAFFLWAAPDKQECCSLSDWTWNGWQYCWKNRSWPSLFHWLKMIRAFNIPISVCMSAIGVRVSCCILIINSFLFLGTNEAQVSWAAVGDSFRAMMNRAQPSLVKLLLQISSGSWITWWQVSAPCPFLHTHCHHPRRAGPHSAEPFWHWPLTHGAPDLLCPEFCRPPIHS